MPNLKWFRIEFAVGAAAAMAWRCGPCAPPEVYDDVAAAAGLCPPMHILPGLWRSLAAPLFSACGLEEGLETLAALGPVAYGVSVALAACILRSVLRWWLAAPAAVGFAFLEPVRRTGCFFSRQSLVLCAMLGALWLLVRMARRCARNAALPYAFAVLTGLIAADTPLAFIVFAALPVSFAGRLAMLPDGTLVSFSGPLTVLFAMRRTLFVFLAAWALGLAASVVSFVLPGAAAGAAPPRASAPKARLPQAAFFCRLRQSP